LSGGQLRAYIRHASSELLQTALRDTIGFLSDLSRLMEGVKVEPRRMAAKWSSSRRKKK